MPRNLPLPAHRQPRLALHQRGERVGVRGSRTLQPLSAGLWKKQRSAQHRIEGSPRMGFPLLLPLTPALSPQERGEGVRAERLWGRAR